MKLTKDHYYCHQHREITTHFFDPESKSILCVGVTEHPLIKWCHICGQRIDTGNCKGHEIN